MDHRATYNAARTAGPLAVREPVEIAPHAIGAGVEVNVTYNASVYRQLDVGSANDRIYCLLDQSVHTVTRGTISAMVHVYHAYRTVIRVTITEPALTALVATLENIAQNALINVIDVPMNCTVRLV